MKGKYSKKIVVKKRMSTRMAFHSLTGAFYVGWTVTTITTITGDESLIFPWVLIVGIPLQLYFELWRITFTSKEIRVRQWPFREKTYSYSMIRKVTKKYYCSENDYLICCEFIDGKNVTFGIKDVNAALAINRLLSHTTIRNVSY